MFLLDAASVRRPDIKVLKPAVAMVWLLFCGLMVSGVQAGPRWRARDQKCPGRSLINFIPTARRIPTSSPHQNHCNQKHRFFIEIFILSIWQLPFQHTQQHRNTLPQKPKVYLQPTLLAKSQKMKYCNILGFPLQCLQSSLNISESRDPLLVLGVLW